LTESGLNIPAAKAPASIVLIIDDEDSSRAVIRASLGRDKHTIYEAADGAEAMTLCSQQLPDVIITDLMMPGVNGEEFVRWFRQTFAAQYVPILMLTARDEIEQKEKGFAVGVDDYLTKPFNHRELWARVNALLRIKHLTDSLLLRTQELERANHELSRMQDVLLKKEREIVAMQLAGAAVHSLGQPITAILLNCRVLEQSLEQKEPANELMPAAAQNAAAAGAAIKKECAVVQKILQKLQSVDPERTKQYMAGIKIIDLDGE